LYVSAQNLAKTDAWNAFAAPKNRLIRAFSALLLQISNAIFVKQKKINRWWFSFADLLEFARRLDLKSRTDLWCGFYY